MNYQQLWMLRLLWMVAVSAIFYLGCPCSQAEASPLVMNQGEDEGPVVRVYVERQERGKVIGIDRQLAGFPILRGSLLIDTDQREDGWQPTPVAGQLPDWEIIIKWGKKVPDLKLNSKGLPVNQLPRFAANRNNSEIKELLQKAAVGSFSEAAIENIEVLAIDGGATPMLELHFISPRSRYPKSRQFRLIRRTVEQLLVDLNMMEAMPAGWPSGLDRSRLICNYDAEGVGYYGSTLIDRVVDETNLPFEIIPFCAEDLRDGALDGGRGVTFPGGSGKSIAKACQPEGIKRLRHFVKDGGAFMGICAGAYLAGSGIDSYAKLHPLVHHQPWAKGKATLDIELTPEGVALLGEEFSTFQTNYNNGPVFVDFADYAKKEQRQPIVSLATFASATKPRRGKNYQDMIGTPAILATHYGKGRVLTISPHPEGRRSLNALVARCLGWTLGVPHEEVKALQITTEEAAAEQAQADTDT